VGTWVIRNVGMDEAVGKFVEGLSSDLRDPHVREIEVQTDVARQIRITSHSLEDFPKRMTVSTPFFDHRTV
jgi:hypothetical protein